MVANPENLIWIDLEMTGLDTTSDAIIEIATVVTDKHLGIIGEGPVLAIHQPESVLEGMDDWNKRTHGNSGLL
ncbi:MAG: exonuclease domain-containing protein, partial [Pseudomonadota bacterium]